MQDQQHVHSFVGDESASWNPPPQQESSFVHNESMQTYHQHHQQFPQAFNQSMNYPALANNTSHHIGDNADLSDNSTYRNMTQAPNNLLPMMQPLNFNGYNGNLQWTPGVFSMNPFNGHLPQSMQQGMVFPPQSGQVAFVSGTPTMSGPPIVYGHVAPARQMNLPMSSLQQQQQSSQHLSQASQGSMNRTLPHQPTERNRSSRNHTFAEFNVNCRDKNKSPRARQSNSSIRQKYFLEMINRSTRKNQDSRQPENREKADKACNISYRFNKNLVATGSIIPTHVTQNYEGLNRIINGLTKDVVRLQQFVQVLVNDRDAEVATKAKLHQNSSTQTIAHETEEKQVQVGPQDGISVDEPQKMIGLLESPLLANSAIQLEPTKESPTDVEEAEKTELSTPTFKPKKSLESAQFTEENSLVSKRLDEANVLAEKVSDFQPSTPTTNSSSLDDNVYVKTGCGENSETPILRNFSHADSDDSPVLSSTNSSIKEAPEKTLNTVELGADPRLSDKIGEIGSERSANTDETGSVKMASEEIHSIPEEKSVERQSDKGGTVKQETYRRAEYADIAKLNLPASPATRAQSVRQRAVNPTSSPNAQGTPNVHLQAQTLPEGFQFQKKSMSTPTLTEEQFRKALAARRLFDSPVLTLIQKTPKVTKSPTRASSQQNPRRSRKKGAPTPKKSSENFGSPEDYDSFVSDERQIFDFSTTIKANLLDYAAKMKLFRVYFGCSPEGRPVMDTLLEKLMNYWQDNRSHIFDQKQLKQVQDNLKARLSSLEAKTDLSSRKLRVFIGILFKTGNNLLSDDFFYLLLLPDKQQQLYLMVKYMNLVTNYTAWNHLLDLPPNHLSAQS